MDSDGEVARILGAWQRAREEGEAPDPEEVLARHPECAGALQAGFEVIRALDRIHAAGVGSGEPPRQVGPYRILREIGRGGMGVVYEAEQVRMKRRVALKILSLGLTRRREAIERFRHEAHAAGRLQHTHIVPVYDLEQHAGTWFYAMELIEGSGLDTVIAELRVAQAGPHRSGARAPDGEAGSTRRSATTTPTSGSVFSSTGDRTYLPEVARMFAGVAEALDLAHQAGVVHRDVKPSNLLLTGQGVLKIVDFGLASIASESSALTRTGEVLGTPAYMSPEQVLGKRARIDHRTDIYSLGATLYEVLALAPPFAGETPPEIYAQILSRDPAPLRAADRRIPRDLETIVAKAMEKDRNRRYASAALLADDLRAFADGAAIRARPVGPVGRTWRRIKRHRVRSALVGLAALLLGVGLLLGLWGSKEATRRTALEYERLCAEAESALTRSRVELDGGPIRGSAAQPASSRELLSRAIALLPARPEAYYLRARSPGRTLEERLADLDAAAERGFRPRTVHLARADITATWGLHDDARIEWRKAMALPRESDSDLVFEARRHLLRGRYPEAIELCTRVIEGLGMTSDARTRGLWIRTSARRKVGDFHGALGDVMLVERVGAAAIGHQIRKASLLRLTGAPVEGEKAFQAVLAGARAARSALAWERLLWACQKTRDHDWHRVVAREAHETLPEARLLTAHLAHALAMWAHHEAEVEALCAELAQREPWHREAERLCAEALEAIGRPQEALQAIERALAMTEQNLSAGLVHARVLAALRRDEESIAAFAALIAEEPEHQRVRVNKGRALIEMGDYAEAARVLEAAAETEADDARLYLGIALERLGRFDEALVACRRATELDPHNGRAWRMLGIVQCRLEQWREARESLSRAIARLSGGEAPDLLHAAMAAWHGGATNEARELYDRAVRWIEEKPAAAEEVAALRAEVAALVGAPQMPGTVPR